MESHSGGISGKKIASPVWFRRRYPTLEDLVMAVEEREALVALAPISSGLFVAPEGDHPAVVMIPAGGSYLLKCWTLAHELAHLILHAGPKNSWTFDRDEAAADRWAARALIPRERINHHGNASVDAFIGALSAHYGDIPADNCPERRLAAQIASTRMKGME